MSTRLRKMVEAAYPEAVARRRAEEVSALATAELLQLVPCTPPTESHQALVQVGWAPADPRGPCDNQFVCGWKGKAHATKAVGSSGRLNTGAPSTGVHKRARRGRSLRG